MSTQTATVNKTEKRVNVRYLTVTAMLSAVAYILMFLDFSVPSAACAGHGLSDDSTLPDHRRSGIYVIVSPCPEEFLICFTYLFYAYVCHLSISILKQL